MWSKSPLLKLAALSVLTACAVDNVTEPGPGAPSLSSGVSGSSATLKNAAQTLFWSGTALLAAPPSGRRQIRD